MTLFACTIQNYKAKPERYIEKNEFNKNSKNEDMVDVGLKGTRKDICTTTR
jgi:hypothetical protein